MAAPYYGLDAELKAKRDAAYDPKLEAEAKNWVESVTGERLVGSLHQALKSGVVLCKLVNKLHPNKISKVGNGNMPFVQMENISQYLKACSSLGLATHDLFQTVDLYEEKNMNQVVTNIIALKRVSGSGNASPAPVNVAFKPSYTPVAQAKPTPAPVASSGNKFCSNCGNKLPTATAKFCPNCGNPC